MNPGEHCIRYCNERDRIKEMEKNSTPEVRHRRKHLLAQHLLEQNGGVVYSAGLF